MKLPRSRSTTFLSLNAWIPYIIIAALMIVINVCQPGQVTFRWLNRQADAAVSLALVSIGQTLVFMIGGTDLSLGGIICFTNCLAAVYMPDQPAGILLMSLALIAIGALAGWFNGLVIVKLKLQPFIATLATWAIWYGAAMCVLNTDGGKVPEAFSGTLMHGFSQMGGMRVSMLILIGLALIGVFFKASPLGIAIRAVGSNERGSYFCGINVDRTKITVYLISGLLAGMSGLFRTAQVASGSPTAGNNFILLSCAAAVIGGCSSASGYFSFTGAIVGAIIMRVLNTLMVTAGVSSYMTSVFQGLILILVVCINSLSTLMKEKRRMEVMIR